jgi:hypothetical protein
MDEIMHHDPFYFWSAVIVLVILAHVLRPCDDDADDQLSKTAIFRQDLIINRMVESTHGRNQSPQFTSQLHMEQKVLLGMGYNHIHNLAISSSHITTTTTTDCRRTGLEQSHSRLLDKTVTQATLLESIHCTRQRLCFDSQCIIIIIILVTSQSWPFAR